MSTPTITALFPMKGQSERVPGKNLRPFCGKPLCLWALETLATCHSIKHIIVDTDSKEIANCVRKIEKVHIHIRPTHLHGNNVPMNKILNCILQHDSIDNVHYIQSHATNPLITAETIEKAINTYFELLGFYDSLFSVTKMQMRLYDEVGKPINHNPEILLNTQDLPPIFEENSNIYIFSRTSFALSGGRRIGMKPYMFSMSKYEAFDIDTEEDFKLAEAALRVAQIGISPYNCR